MPASQPTPTSGQRRRNQSACQRPAPLLSRIYLYTLSGTRLPSTVCSYITHSAGTNYRTRPLLITPFCRPMAAGAAAAAAAVTASDLPRDYTARRPRGRTARHCPLGIAAVTGAHTRAQTTVMLTDHATRDGSSWDLVNGDTPSRHFDTTYMTLWRTPPRFTSSSQCHGTCSDAPDA